MAKPALNQFNGGEFSPWLAGRVDLPKYGYSVEKSLNFIPLVEGSVKKRGGSHFVAPIKEVEAVKFSIKVVPEGLDAVIFINNELRKELYVPAGEAVTYSVSCDGYLPVSGTYKVDENTELTVELVSTLYKSTLTIETEPEDCDVYINGVLGRSKEVVRGSVVTYGVYKDGYDAEEKSVQISQDMKIKITLGMSFEIRANPVDAAVVINGTKTNRVNVQPGDVVEWSVSKEGYSSKSGKETIEKSIILEVSLSTDGYALNQTVFERSDPGRYVIDLAKAGFYGLEICSPGGGAGGASYAYGIEGKNGSSGAAYAGKIKLNAGKTVIKLGTPGKGGAAHKMEGACGEYYFSLQSFVDAQTYFGQPNGTFILLNGGVGGEGAKSGASTTGGGGYIAEFDKVVESFRRIKTNGVKYSTVSPLNNGYGGGGSGGSGNGNDGGRAYCKLVYLGQA